MCVWCGGGGGGGRVYSVLNTLKFICFIVVYLLASRLTGDQEVAGSTSAGSATFFCGDLIKKYFSTVILSLLLIHEGQLSVSGERMCTLLVNRLEDLACPINVWLGKMTTLNMTPLG